MRCFLLLNLVFLQLVFTVFATNEDPSIWPGHLKPFGTEQNTVIVDTIDHWPSPTGKKFVKVKGILP